jgi:integrase
MARQSGIWWWKSRKCYYCWHNGRQRRLDANKTKATRMWAELIGRREAPGEDMMVLSLLNLYLDWSEANHAKSTHGRVRASVLSFGKSLPPGLRINKLLSFHLTTWLDERYPKQPKDDSKPASENTRHDIASDVLAVFNWAVRQKIILGSPLQGYTKPPKTPRVLYLSPEQMDDLFTRIEDHEFRDFLVVALRTGCRPQEVRVLEAKYVLFKEKVARIPKELAKGKRKERRVPLDDVVLAILKPLALKYPEGPLLRNTRGRPWTKDAVNCRFQRLKEKLPYRATAYAMRHTFINEALRNGASETALAKVCGHEDKTMILKVYGHANLHNDLLKETVKKANRRAAHR